PLRLPVPFRTVVRTGGPKGFSPVANRGGFARLPSSELPARELIQVPERETRRTPTAWRPPTTSTHVTWTVSPAWREGRRPVSPVPERTGVPSRETMTSPAISPAAWAGLPAITPLTRAPEPTGATKPGAPWPAPTSVSKPPTRHGW